MTVNSLSASQESSSKEPFCTWRWMVLQVAHVKPVNLRPDDISHKPLAVGQIL